MIAHRGGYDFDDDGENTISNILYTCRFFPGADIEIDVYWHQKKFVVCHDPPKGDRPLLGDVLGHLQRRFHNILYLDIKSSIEPKVLFDLLSLYRIKYRIHSFNRMVVDKLRQEKNCLPFDVEIGYASETGEEMPADYLVFPKSLYRVSRLPIFWYTFGTAREAAAFRKDKQGDHDCFVDYLGAV